MFDGKVLTLLDGATGTNMMAAGMPAGVCVEKWILEHPKELLKLQEAYVTAGSQIVYAPTFGANEWSLEAYGLKDQMQKMNQALVALTRSAVGGQAKVAASISSTGKLISPFGEAGFDELVAVYSRQIQAVRDAGADLVMGETLLSLQEARAVLLAAREQQMPCAITLTVQPGGKTIFGTDFTAALVTLQAMGACAIGLNCSCGPDSLAPVLRAAAPYAWVPLIAKPNAGDPGAFLEPEAFAQSCINLWEAGATVLGGCCGTTPAHIAALKKALWGKKPVAIAQKEGAFAAVSGKILPLQNGLQTSQPIRAGDSIQERYLDASPEEPLRIWLPDEATAAEAGNQGIYCPAPLLFTAPKDEILEIALRHYAGRAIVPGGSSRTLCARYGAIILVEKQPMNQIRRVVNHVIAPAYGLVSILLLLTGSLLMDANPQANAPLFLCLLGIIALLTIAMFVSVPFIRKREAALECAKLSFDYTDQPDQERYVFCTDDHEVMFDQTGIAVNGILYPWQNMYRIQVETSNKNMLIHIWISIETVGDVCLLPLNGSVLHALEQFHVPVENQQELEYIVEQPYAACQQILKYGKIKRL